MESLYKIEKTKKNLRYFVFSSNFSNRNMHSASNVHLKIFPIVLLQFSQQ